MDGRDIPARVFSPFDVVSLKASTNARFVRFNLATGISSSRLAGHAPSTEITIDVSGRTAEGNPQTESVTIAHPGGQSALTGLGVALGTARMLGLEGRGRVPPGLYLPETVMDADWYVQQMRADGAIFQAGTPRPHEAPALTTAAPFSAAGSNHGLEHER